MKILVCVKQVPDTSGKVAVNPDGTLNRASMQTANFKERADPIVDAGTHGRRHAARADGHGR